jgi:endonuclease YncB( thermonuclease family)
MYEYDAEILRVVDGDTLVALIDVGFNTHVKSTLRLYGINTPEKRTKNLEEKEKGIAASDRVTQLLEQCDNKVRVKSHGLGKFGRCLAEVQFTFKGNTTNLNRTLVAEGHAEEYFGGSREG